MSQQQHNTRQDTPLPPPRLHSTAIHTTPQQRHGQENPCAHRIQFSLRGAAAAKLQQEPPWQHVCVLPPEQGQSMEPALSPQDTYQAVQVAPCVPHIRVAVCHIKPRGCLHTAHALQAAQQQRNRTTCALTACRATQQPAQQARINSRARNRGLAAACRVRFDNFTQAVCLPPNRPACSARSTPPHCQNTPHSPGSAQSRQPTERADPTLLD